VLAFVLTAIAPAMEFLGQVVNYWANAPTLLVPGFTGWLDYLEARLR
jgi:hypothetical protein